jgi:CheY-like chemotaxis protein
VLVIDDDATARDLLQRLLHQDGFGVVTAASGEEGLQLARELRPDVITLDVMMPRMDGWAVLTLLKDMPDLADIPVIIVTMIDEKQIGFALGAADYMVKPIDRNRLVELLQKYRREADAHSAGNILVVEDDAAARSLLRRMLEKEGWQVTEAGNGQVALDMLAEQQPDLIILDLMMPALDGFQFVKRLRTLPTWRDVPVIVITAKELTPADREWLDATVDTTLQKGMYSRDELLQDVRALVLSYMRR